jgi:iron complex transport system substrate-binding protein
MLQRLLILLLTLPVLVSVIPVAAQDLPEGYPVTVTDMNGRELTFDEPPQRVVCLLNRCAQELAFLGVAPVAVGAPYTYNVARDPLNFGELAETFGQINQTDGVDVEQIAAYQPDLIIGEVDLAPAVEEIAPLYSYSWDASVWQNVDNFTTDVRNFGRIFGMETQVDAKIQDVLDRVEAYAALSPNDRSHLVIFFNDSTGSSLWIPGDCGLFLSQLSPCANANGGDWIEGTMETLLSFDPDVLIVEQYSVDDEAAMLENLNENDPLWNELTAVKNGTVHLVPVSQARTNTIQSVKGAVDTLMPIIYPEVFPAALTDEQVQEILAREEENTSNYPVTVVDDAGRELTFNAPPQRVVAYFDYGFGQVATLGVWPVGGSINPGALADLARFGKEERDFVNVFAGDGIDYEIVTSLAPELIVVSCVEDIAVLEEIAPTFLLSCNPSLEDMIADLRELGRVFGRQAEAEEAITKILNRIEAYDRMVTESTEIMLIGVSQTDNFSMFTDSFIACEIFDFIGQCDWPDPNADDGWISGGTEVLLSFDPEVIVIANWTGQSMDETLADLADQPLWSELRATREGRVVALDDYPDPYPVGLSGVARFLDALAPAIHPDIFPEPLTDEQVQDILAEAQ